MQFMIFSGSKDASANRELYVRTVMVMDNATRG